MAILIGRIGYWLCHSKAIKGQAISYHSANKPFEHYEPMTWLFPDESVLTIELDEDEHPYWRLCFLGDVNVYGNGVGAVLTKRILLPVAG